MLLASRIPPLQVPSDPSSVEWKKVAAVEEFFEIISAYHCTEDGFHLGIKKTLAKVSLHCKTTCMQKLHAHSNNACQNTSKFGDQLNLAIDIGIAKIIIRQNFVHNGRVTHGFANFTNIFKSPVWSQIAKYFDLQYFQVSVFV